LPTSAPQEEHLSAKCAEERLCRCSIFSSSFASNPVRGVITFTGFFAFLAGDVCANDFLEVSDFRRNRIRNRVVAIPSFVISRFGGFPYFPTEMTR
jgi:hypothetical protein